MPTERITLVNARGQRLVGTVHRGEGTVVSGGVVVCHGMLSHRGSEKHVALCRSLASRGLSAMRFDFAGRGDSDGRLEDLSYHGEVEDLAAAVAWLAPRAGPVALVGSSMGGAVALLYASRDGRIASVAGLATVGRPASIADRLGEPGFRQRWEREGTVLLEGGLRLGAALLQSAQEVDVVAAASAIRCPLLLVHGDEDDVVPLDQAEELHRAAEGSRLEVISGADHVFSRAEDRLSAIGLVVDHLAASFADGESPRS